MSVLGGYRLRKSIWGTLVRVAAGLLLIALVVRQIGVGALWSMLAEVQLGWLAVAGALVVVMTITSTYRWMLLLEAVGLRVPFREALRLYLVGLFASNFLPSSVGGDVVKVWMLGRSTGRTPAAAASAIADRVTGGWALGAAALVAIPAGGSGVWYLWPSVALLALVMGAASLLLFRPDWVGATGDWCERRGWPRAAGALRQGAEALGAYRNQPGTLVVVLLWAMLFQGVVAGVNYGLLRALGQSLSPMACFGYTALILAATLVPISIGGLGVREATSVQLFGLAGVSAQAAVGASLLYLAVVAVVSLPGGLAWIQGDAAKRKEMVDMPEKDAYNREQYLPAMKE
jgi:glycosyltransferase 2 family protein